MRYNTIETITFTDIDGTNYAVKDIRPIEELTTSVILNIDESTMFDELATRKNVFGEGNEALAYKIFDLNVLALTELDFDSTKLRKIRIPNL